MPSTTTMALERDSSAVTCTTASGGASATVSVNTTPKQGDHHQKPLPTSFLTTCGSDRSTHDIDRPESSALGASRRRSTRDNRKRSFARDTPKFRDVGRDVGDDSISEQPRRYTENARDSARLRGARSFFLRRTCAGAGASSSVVATAHTQASHSARSLPRWESTRHITERTESDARATFARSRNRALRHAGGATDALDAFGPALTRVHDTRALARTLHTLHAGLPLGVDAPAAALHADSLARAAALADNTCTLSLSESTHTCARRPPNRAPSSDIIEAAAPFGDCLALAAVAAAACGRVGVRRKVRRDSAGSLRASLTVRTGKVLARVDVEERGGGEERVSVAVAPNSAWPWSPSRRNAFDSLLKTFRIEWNALGVEAPPQESRRSASSRVLRRRRLQSPPA